MLPLLSLPLQSLIVKLFTFILFINSALSIFNCTVLNSLNSSLCDTCENGFRLTLNKMKCLKDKIPGC